MGWPPQFGGNPDPNQSYLGYLSGGSAISAPPPPLIVLLVGLLLSRRQDRWRFLGLTLVALVALMFTIGTFGEFFAEHSHVPTVVIFVFGAVRLLISSTLVLLVVRQWRTSRRADAAYG